VFGKNIESFPKSDNDDESCDSDSDTGDSDEDSDGSYNNGDDVSAAVIDRGYTEEDDINVEDLAISDDESDLHGDAVASFSFASLMNALLDPSDDDNKVIKDSVTIESVVTVESLDMTWFDTYSVGDLRRRALISFFPQGV
jgi:hypothetical protein